MKCWRCGKAIDKEGMSIANFNDECSSCKNQTLAEAKEAIKRAKVYSDNMEDRLTNFKEKIKAWRTELPPSPRRDVNRYIHHLCLMADELEDKVNNKIVIDSRDKQELLEKIKLIQELAEKLSLS